MIQISFRACTQSSRPQGWQRPLQIMLSLEAEGDTWSHPPAAAAVLGPIALPEKGVGLTDRHSDRAGKREMSFPAAASCGMWQKVQQVLQQEQRSGGAGELLFISHPRDGAAPLLPNRDHIGCSPSKLHPPLAGLKPRVPKSSCITHLCEWQLQLRA